MTREKGGVFRPSRNCQIAALGRGAVKVSRTPTPQALQEHVARASRVRMRAVGAQRRTLYGVVSSAYDSGRDGRLNPLAHLTQSERPSARSVQQILRTIEHDMCAPKTATRGA